VVDLRDGRLVSSAAIVQDATLRVRSFDGEKIVLEGIAPEGHACRARGVMMRTLTPAGDGLVAEDTCGLPRPALTRDRDAGPREWAGKATSLRFEPTGYGTWIDARRNGGEAWTAYARGTRDSRLPVVHEVEDALLLERHGSQVASLECLDAATGRPRWTYVYPAHRGFGNWEVATRQPPRGTVPAKGFEQARKGRDAARRAIEQLPYPAPVTLDPSPTMRPFVDAVVP
jgi:hypothetical protein